MAHSTYVGSLTLPNHSANSIDVSMDPLLLSWIGMHLIEAAMGYRGLWLMPLHGNILMRCGPALKRSLAI
jgi:hypothetical protein